MLDRKYRLAILKVQHGEREGARVTLAELKLSELKRRALAAGLHDYQMDEVDDSDDPKQTVVELLISAESGPVALHQDRARHELNLLNGKTLAAPMLFTNGQSDTQVEGTGRNQTTMNDVI